MTALVVGLVLLVAPLAPLAHVPAAVAASQTRGGGGLLLLGGSYGLFTIDADQPEHANYVNHNNGGSHGYRDAQWSPDGREILYGDVLTQRHYYVSDWSGRRVTRLDPFGDGRLEGAWWSADSQHLYVARHVAPASTELWRVTRDGTQKTLVIDADEFTGSRELATSPDGSAVVFLRDYRAGFELVRHDLGTDEEQVLLQGNDYLTDVDWSPDGTQLAYSTVGSLRRMDADGTEVEQLLATPSSPRDYARHVAWSPDGSSIAFSTGVLSRLSFLEVGTRQVSTLNTRSGDGIDVVDWQLLPACTVLGTPGDDQLFGTPGDDVVCAGGGDDVVGASAGEDLVLGGAGADRIDFSASPTKVDVDLSTAYAQAAGYTELVSVEAASGSAGADTLRGSSADDALSGGPGADTVLGGPGADALDGGPGRDLADFDVELLTLDGDAATDAIDVDLGAGRAVSSQGVVDTLSGLEDVRSAHGGGDLIGDDGPNQLIGTTTNLVEGRGGDDLITTDGTVTYAHAPGPVQVDLNAGEVRGAAGHDVITRASGVIGSSYDDWLKVGRIQAIEAGPGDDTLVRSRIFGNEPAPGLGATDGGTGVDTLDLSTETRGVQVEASTAGGRRSANLFERPVIERLPHVATGIDRYLLTSHDDVFLGSDQADVVSGGGGNDTISGGDGADSISGGGGNDVLVDGGGGDQVWGGTGNDTFRPGGGNDRFSASTGVDRLDLSGLPVGVRVNLGAHRSWGWGTDLATGFEQVVGTRYADTLIGDAAPNLLVGAGGRDVLNGAAGADVLQAARGGADRLIGGPGRDWCSRDRKDKVKGC